MPATQLPIDFTVTLKAVRERDERIRRLEAVVAKQDELIEAYSAWQQRLKRAVVYGVIALLFASYTAVLLWSGW